MGDRELKLSAAFQLTGPKKVGWVWGGFFGEGWFLLGGFGCGVGVGVVGWGLFFVFWGGGCCGVLGWGEERGCCVWGGDVPVNKPTTSFDRNLGLPLGRKGPRRKGTHANPSNLKRKYVGEGSASHSMASERNISEVEMKSPSTGGETRRKN